MGAFDWGTGEAVAGAGKGAGVGAGSDAGAVAEAGAAGSAAGGGVTAAGVCVDGTVACARASCDAVRNPSATITPEAIERPFRGSKSGIKYIR